MKKIMSYTRAGYILASFCSMKGFTLIEILVVVLIIGILGAIALPQYQRAVLKSRFAALMPIAKSMADSNEAYYLEYGEYADNAEDLPVQGRMNYSDGTELEFGTTSEYSYVLATRDNDFPNNYIVYQKHSEQYPGEIHCEAASDNTLAQDVCKSFGPTQELGETLTPGYLTYVLFGTGNGEPPSGDEGGNESGTNTEPEPEPEPLTCGGVSKPANIVVNNESITGTASCVDGKWVWQWTGEKEITANCTTNTTTQCSSAIYSGAFCKGTAANACSNSVFTEYSYCRGTAANACSNSVFIGTYESSNVCFPDGKGACTNSLFLRGNCLGYHSGDCAGSTFMPGSSCMALESSACDGAKYGYDENGNMGYCAAAVTTNSAGTCPTGVPRNGTGTSWSGGCCNPAYMANGVCPSNIPECE